MEENSVTHAVSSSTSLHLCFDTWNADAQRNPTVVGVTLWMEQVEHKIRLSNLQKHAHKTWPNHLEFCWESWSEKHWARTLMFHGCKCKLKWEQLQPLFQTLSVKAHQTYRQIEASLPKIGAALFVPFSAGADVSLKKECLYSGEAGAKTPRRPPPQLHCSTAPLPWVCTFFNLRNGTATKYHRIMDNSQFSRLMAFFRRKSISQLMLTLKKTLCSHKAFNKKLSLKEV